jgi:hypothetical protein
MADIIRGEDKELAGLPDEVVVLAYGFGHASEREER